MRKNDQLPEVFRSDNSTTLGISRMLKSGDARKLGPKLYTRNMVDDPVAIVRSNLWHVVALMVPGSVVSYRTAFENRPAADGSVFVTGEYPRQIPLPGLTIRQVAGHGQMEGDMPYMGALFLASRPRAFLENLTASRQRGLVSKAVGQEEVETRLSKILRVGGKDALNKVRDEARQIAPMLDLEEEFGVLESRIGGLLASHSTNLITPVARAYAAGEPYDPARLPLFDTLFAALRSTAFPIRQDRSTEPPAFHNVAFYDAYFSNYIEGTDFPVEQAMRIVFENEIPSNRPADAHDVLGTYRLVGSRDEMSKCPKDFDDFLRLVKRRHALIMEARPERLPGRFKTQNNQAGSTLFVAPELVTGTLRQGYQRYEALDESFARALFMMFLVAAVHPFTDGNGRMARVMMNAELISHGQTRIFIPSVYRNEYLNSLKGLTNNRYADAFIRVMSQAQLFVSRIDFADLRAAQRVLEAHNAFCDPTDDVKLKLPEG